MMDITANDIHLWYAFPDEITNPSLLSKYKELLTDDERTRLDRFKFQRDQKIHLVAWALMRTVLSQYTEVAPAAWRFSANAHGKPEIQWPSLDISLAFNLSHTGGLVAFAVNLGNDIGVDVENTQRSVLDDSFVRRYFAAKEVSHLRERPDQWIDRFYEYWTLKESYIKARGMGLSIPLDSFWFDMPEERALKIVFESGSQDRPDKWHFWLMQPTETHKAAMANCVPSGVIKTITSQKIVPLAQIMPYHCKVIRRTGSSG